MQDHYQHSSCNPLVDLNKTKTNHCIHGGGLSFQSVTRYSKLTNVSLGLQDNSK